MNQSALELISVCTYAYEHANHKDLSFATMCVLSFAALFHSNQLLDIRVCHLTVSLPDNVILRLLERRLAYIERARMYLYVSPEILLAHIICCVMVFG